MINEVINGIKPLYKDKIEEAKIRVDSLAKPLGSLGRLEDLAIQISGITGNIKNSIRNKGIIIMSADNGVVEEGVASSPQYVTLAQTKNFIKGKTGVCAIGKTNDTKLIVVDIGINSDEKINGIVDKKISKGTRNIYKENAMSYEEAKRGIEIGIEMAKKAKDEGFDIIGVGEMGIGNTTTSAAVLMCLIDCKVDKVVGKGAGVTEEAFNKKKLVVKTAVESKDINRMDPMDIISKVGGYDIAGRQECF